MGYNVGDDDGTSKTPLVSLPCSTCSTLPYSVLVCFVCRSELNVEEIMYKLFESIQRAMMRDQPKTPEPTYEEHAAQHRPCGAPRSLEEPEKLVHL